MLSMVEMKSVGSPGNRGGMMMEVRQMILANIGFEDRNVMK